MNGMVVLKTPDARKKDFFFIGFVISIGIG
jgi:hypothetical protein